jgi:predicted kinase
MLIGVPGSGKSTWIKNQDFDWDTTVVASTDNYVDKIAAERGLTYNDVFNDVMHSAVTYMVGTVNDAVDKGLDIVWDQTNTTRASRRKKFPMLPGYRVIAVVFRTPPFRVLQQRLNSRPGKNIPPHVVKSMVVNFEIPTLDEGFDDIIFVY